MAYLTIRNLPREVAQRLDEERRARGRSLNQTVIDLLARSVGLGDERRSNGLGTFAGSWSREEYEAFEKSVVDLERIDQELWR